MTLQGVLYQRIPPTVIPQPVLQAPDVDRTAWIGGGGRWKGGKGNSNNALSALTLLAFLFFLNILQNCLRDTIGQNPGVMVMMVPTTTAATMRRKREQLEWEQVTTESPLPHWTESQITNRVHDQIQSYWASGKERPIYNDDIKHHRIDKNPDPYKNAILHTKHYKEPVHTDTNNRKQEITNRISAKLNAINKSTEKYRHKKQHQKEDMLNIPVEITLNGSTGNKSYFNEELPQWKKTVGGILKSSRAYIENKCCGLISNWTNVTMNGGVGNVNLFNSLMRRATFWICNNVLTKNC